MDLVDPHPMLDDTGTAAPHPEEMKASIELALGRGMRLRATARATPAGLAMAALLCASILVPAVLLARMRPRASTRLR